MNESGAALMMIIRVPEEVGDEFNSWYDEEHIPDRLAIPDMLRIRRFVSLGEGILTSVTHYELASLDVLDSGEYAAVNAAQQTRTTEILGKTTHATRFFGSTSLRSKDAGLGHLIVSLNQAISPEELPSRWTIAPVGDDYVREADVCEVGDSALISRFASEYGANPDVAWGELVLDRVGTFPVEDG